MKKKIMNIILSLVLGAMCLTMTTPALATDTTTIDPRVELAVQAIYEAYQNGTDATVKIEVSRAESQQLYYEITRNLNGIISGVQLETKGAIPKNDNADTIELRIAFGYAYPASQLTELDSDSRIISEMEALNHLATFQEKVTEINRFVSEAAKYDFVLAQQAEKIPNNHSSATAMGCLNGLAVCQGFANLSSYFYERIGIENVKVRCVILDQQETHVFNMVRDAAGTMYVVDPTLSNGGWNTCLTDLDSYTKQFNISIVTDPETLFTLKYQH